MRKRLKFRKRRLCVSLALFLLPLAGCDQPAGGPLPDPPARLDKLIPGPARIAASWPVVPGADCYEVWIGETESLSDAALAQTVDLAFALIEGLDYQKTYWVWVRSRNRSGASAFTAPLSESPHRIEVYKPGYYWSVGKLWGGETVVGTEFSAYAILSVEIIDYYDDAERPQVALALETLPAAIVAADSPEVDGVTGATYTSDRIKDAVRQNMEQAKK
jgi:uncharacterized protein with FMN-binding domain